jgi:hypothetical protein
MLTELSEKDQDMKAMKVDFFNQQEALVRETNLLKNKLHSTTATTTTNVNQTSVEHLMSRPPPPPHLASSSSSSASSRGGVELKDLLHKEALLQDLHDQVVRMGELE